MSLVNKNLSRKSSMNRESNTTFPDSSIEYIPSDIRALTYLYFSAAYFYYLPKSKRKMDGLTVLLQINSMQETVATVSCITNTPKDD